MRPFYTVIQSCDKTLKDIQANVLSQNSDINNFFDYLVHEAPLCTTPIKTLVFLINLFIQDSNLYNDAGKDKEILDTRHLREQIYQAMSIEDVNDILAVYNEPKMITWMHASLQAGYWIAEELIDRKTELKKATGIEIKATPPVPNQKQEFKQWLESGADFYSIANKGKKKDATSEFSTTCGKG